MAFEIDGQRLNQVAQHGHEVIGATNALANTYNKLKESGIPIKAKALVPLTGISALAVAVYKDQSCSKSGTCDATQQIVTFSIYFLFLTTLFTMTMYAVHGCRGRKEIVRRLDNLETRQDNSERRVDNIETQQDNADKRLDNLETRQDNTDKRLDKTDRRFNRLVKSTKALSTSTKTLSTAVSSITTLIPPIYAGIDQMGGRITQTENRSLWSFIFPKQPAPMPASSTAIQAAPAV